MQPRCFTTICYDKTVGEVASEQTDLSDEELDEVLDAKKMTGT